MASASSFSSSLAPLSGFNSSTKFSARRPDAVRFRRPLQISAAYASVERPPTSTSTKFNSLYDVLGIETSATCQEIKQAYRRLARVSHPDVACSGDDEFIRIHSAYATLSDPEKRADYDRTMLVTRCRMMSSASYGYGNRRWETDQCW